jgi:YbbR domain-containing protein
MIRFLFRNWVWKLTALALACGLWLALNGGANELIETISVPVQYRNLPANMEIGSDVVERIHLVLRGPSPLLSRASSNPPPVVVDLHDSQTPGERSISIVPTDVRLPGGVSLERTMPGQIRLRLEPREVKQVPVIVRLEHVPEGMLAVVDHVTPDRLTIAGPESRVRLIDHVESDAVDLRRLGADGRIITRAYLPDAHLNFTVDPSLSVHVSLKAAGRAR